ncbi:MAG: helix-turn-helix transcriptional regulator [Alphaproteobacteria bacterium]
MNRTISVSASSPAASMALASENARAPWADRVVTEADAAALLSISVPQLRRLRRAGTAPAHVRLSARRLGYRLSAIAAWLDGRTVVPECAE